MSIRFVVFLVINFAALGIGSFLMGKGASSDWYLSLNKAPWTPPGWVFGAAWTLIMVCFSFYMAFAWNATSNRNALIALFLIQWILNVTWNPTFFRFHNSFASLFIIISLTALVGYFLFNYYSNLKLKTVFIAPYFLWLLIATSLNAYIYIKN